MRLRGSKARSAGKRASGARARTRVLAAALAILCAFSSLALDAREASAADVGAVKRASEAALKEAAMAESRAEGGSLRYAAKTPKISKKKLTLSVGEKATLKVTGTSKKVSWSSSNKKVAAVSAKGVVTAKKAGSAKITAKVAGKKLVCSVTVAKRVVLSAKDKLKEYVLKSGVTNSDGNKEVEISVDGDDMSQVYSIEYDAAEDSFWFFGFAYFESTGDATSVGMEIPYEDSIDEISIPFIMNLRGDEYLAFADIAAATYDNDKGAYFELISPADCPAGLAADIEDLASDYFRLAMQKWDAMVKKGAGIGMRDLGFRSF